MKFLRKNTLLYYSLQAIFGTLFLFLLLTLYGSSTIWEIILYYSLILLTGVEMFIVAALSYSQKSISRSIINHFFVGDTVSTAFYLYQSRNYTNELLVHNMLTYVACWVLWYGALVFETPLLFYGISGILVHLGIDIGIEYFEHQTLIRWFWPISKLYRYIQMSVNIHGSRQS